jgi:hypothetical protein
VDSRPQHHVVYGERDAEDGADGQDKDIFPLGDLDVVRPSELRQVVALDADQQGRSLAPNPIWAWRSLLHFVWLQGPHMATQPTTEPVATICWTPAATQSQNGKAHPTQTRCHCEQSQPFHTLRSYSQRTRGIDLPSISKFRVVSISMAVAGLVDKSCWISKLRGISGQTEGPTQQRLPARFTVLLQPS